MNHGPSDGARCYRDCPPLVRRWTRFHPTKRVMYVSRIRRKAAAVMLSALTIAGLSMAGTAQAAEIGFVRLDVDNSVGHTKEWTRDWNNGWNECRAEYPATKSIELNGTGGIEPHIFTDWDCFDTP
jgi:hypothetical protein